MTILDLLNQELERIHFEILGEAGAMPVMAVMEVLLTQRKEVYKMLRKFLETPPLIQFSELEKPEIIK